MTKSAVHNFDASAASSVATATRQQPSRMARFPRYAWIALLCMLALSMAVWYATQHLIYQSADARFGLQVNELQSLIENRIQKQIDALRGGVALFSAGGKVDRQQWRAYVNALRLEDNFPGLRGYGFSLVVKPQDKARHIDSVRKEGFPEYTIKPEGQRDLFTSIVYLEPFSGRNLRAFGYDMFSEPTRRTAMERARDTGQPALSAMVTLVQETDKDIQRGFLLYLPVYRPGLPVTTAAERRAALFGYVYSPFRINDLMRGILQDQHTIKFEIYDGDAAHANALLYDSNQSEHAEHPEHGTIFKRFSRSVIAGHPWTIFFQADNNYFSRAERTLPYIVSAGGAAISILLFLTIGLLGQQRRRAEQIAMDMTAEFRAVSATMRTIVDTVVDGIITCDSRGTIHAINPAAEKIFGYRADEIIGQSIMMLIPRSNSSRHLRAFFKQIAFSEGAIVESGHEMTARRKDGSLFSAELGVSSFMVDNRKMFVGSVRDISIRRRAEQILRDAQAETRKLALVAAHTKAHIIIADSEGKTEWVNDAFAEFTGYSRAEMIGRRPGDMLRGPDTNEEDIRSIRSAIASGQPFHGEQINYTKTGRKFWAELNGAAIFADNGKVSNYIIVRTDITGRKSLEQERDRNREVLDLVIQNVPSAILLKDATSGRYVLANRVAEQYLGQGPGSLIGKRAQDILPKPTADIVDARDREVAESSERTSREEYPIELPGKGRRIHSSTRQCIVDERGQPRFLLAVINDVTEHKKMAEQLQQSQKMEAVGKLTGGLAHDFNNLLMIMVGNLEVLQEMSPDPEQTQIVDSILQAALRGSDLTKQLLAFSRQQPLQPRRIDVNEQLGQTAQLLRRTLGQNVNITLQLGNEIGETLVDPAQFESAVVNISINARDAMPNGGTLDIQTSRRPVDEEAADRLGVASGDYALVKISDSGTGMAPELLSRIFEPFFTTKAPGKGTGLGLSMVYGFMKQSKGTVIVNSQEGKGTTFELLLPLVPAAEQPLVASPPTQPAAPRGENKHVILAVDDNPRVRATAVSHLRALGYHVIEADDGKSALAMLDEIENIDLLFTDIIMPGGMDGIQLAKAARAKRPDLKVLYTSGFPGNDAIANAATDMDAPLLTKPYRKQKLIDAVAEVMAAA